MKTTKDQTLKIRVSKEGLIKLDLKADALNMNRSDYIRHCCLSDNSLTLDQAPLYIKTIHLLNDIVHQLDGYTDPETLITIKDMILTFYEGVKNDEKHRH